MCMCVTSGSNLMTVNAKQGMKKIVVKHLRMAPLWMEQNRS